MAQSAAVSAQPQPLPAEAAPPGAVPPPPPPPRRRDPLLDNAKFVLIVLVVVGHLWEMGMSDESRFVRAAYLFVYAFHMPAFVLISGYLSRSFEGRPQQFWRLITGVLVPFVLFNLAFSALLQGDPRWPVVSFRSPSWVNWFLLSLLLWRLTAPLWRMVRLPVLWSLLVSCLAGTSWVQIDLPLARVLQFLPFFVIGMTLRPEHLDRLRTRTVRVLAVPVLPAVLVAAYWAAPRYSRLWLTGKYTALDAHVSEPHWILVHCGLVALALIMTAAFLALVPRRRGWWTGMGSATMYALLLHGFAVKRLTDLPDWAGTPLGEVALTLAGAAFAVLLMSPPVRMVFRPFVEPRLNWLLRAR